MMTNSSKLKTLLLPFVLLVLLFIFIGDENLLKVISINIVIVVSYLLFKPKNIFHPNNLVFAFSFLYIVLPSSLQLIYTLFNIEYILPWGRPTDWFAYQNQTYFDMLIMFLVFFYGFAFFNKNDFSPTKKNYMVNPVFLASLFVLVFILLAIFLQRTGGVSAWLANYKENFLLGRKGLGVLNFLLLFLVNYLVFLLGLIAYEKTGYRKARIIIFSLFFIIAVSLLQGIKSRVIILLLIFFFPYLLHVKLNVRRLVTLGGAFFFILFVGNYIRSNGFYSSQQMLVEYLMTYFNVYRLHDIVVLDYDVKLFETVHHILVKPGVALGLIDPSVDYDISVMLTKEYFPKDWELLNATQQWPLATELYLNYYGIIFGWIFILVYVVVLSKMYHAMKKGNIAISLIFLLELLRLFTVQRGVLIPWQMPIYLFFYVIYYYLTELFVRVK